MVVVGNVLRTLRVQLLVLIEDILGHCSNVWLKMFGDRS